MPKPLSEWIDLLLIDEQIPENIVFRVDAGRIWGLSFGHVSRCLTLARRFQKSYHSETLFLMRDYAEGVEYARNAGQQVEIMPVDITCRQETDRIMETAKAFKADLVIVDLPYQDVDTSYFTSLRRRGTKIIFLDDCRYISPDANIILNSSILAVEKTQQIQHIRYLLGPEYFIYEDLQRDMGSYKSKKRRRVLITFGGSDPSGLTLKVVETLCKKHWDGVKFTLVLGPGYSGLEQINKCLQGGMNSIQVVCNPPEMYPLFLESDLAICAGGRTLYELYVSGIPTFAIASIEYEIPVIQAFLKQHLLVAGLTGWDEQEFTNGFEKALTTFLSR